MRGHWTKERPAKDGLYWTATRDGELDRPQVVAYNEKGECIYAGMSIHRPSDGWGGWWWSEPVEKPPAPPAWDDTDRRKTCRQCFEEYDVPINYTDDGFCSDLCMHDYEKELDSPDET